MDFSPSVTSQKSYGLPKPETGLAEWTSKIKALQKEVDADEEAEQKRLEDEIAAARQARLSRSRGTTPSRINSSDISISKEHLSTFSNDSNDISANDTPRTQTEWKIDQETALRKLMGRNEVYNPDTISASSRVPSAKSDGIPLAAFIGGNATGPRLNRHAPQPDAHDPTQFIQPDLSNPHPVFGRGGIAMPGMGPKSNKPAASSVGSEHSERYRPTSLAATKSMSSLGSSDFKRADTTSQIDSADLNRRSYGGVSKPVLTTPMQTYGGKADTSLGTSTSHTLRNQRSFGSTPLDRPMPSSTIPPFSMKDEPVIPEVKPLSAKPSDAFRSNSNTVISAPKSTTSTSSLYMRGVSGSPTKSSDRPWIQKPSVNSMERPSYSSASFSSAQKLEDTGGHDVASSSGKESTDTFRSKQTSFATASKAAPSSVTMSYLSKKEDTTPQSLPPTKSADAFRASSSASKPLPTYMGTGGSFKSTMSSTGTSTAAPSATTTDTPLRRLMERNKVHNPDKLAMAESSRKSVAERAQTVSLGAFMGGNGTGIRLNKPAPQPDPTDPTQYIQPDTSAPHPIFGKGGVAMPGMTARKPAASSDTPVGSESSERYRPSATTRPTWPPVSTSRVEKTEARPVSPQKTGNRERTTSAPSSQVQTLLQSTNDRSSSNKVAGRQSPTKEMRAITPTRDRTISGPSYTGNHNVFTSRPLSSQSSVSMSSLARPIQPIPKATSLSPQIPFTTPSTAFQKPAPQKDLTPSISRLQGRGFVQNMVKVSAQFEASPSPPPSADKSRPVSSGGRKGSVLDRWKPKVELSSPTKLSFPSIPTPTKRSSTAYESNENYTKKPHTIKSVASLPSLTKAADITTTQVLTREPAENTDQYARPRTPGLGSATTMVLIKPSKSSTDLTQLPLVDELGVKRDSWRGQQKDNTQYHAPTQAPPSSKKTLIHPTKDRPKKPRKHVERQESSEVETSRLADRDDTSVIENSPIRTQSPESLTPSALSLKTDGAISRTEGVDDSQPSAEVGHIPNVHDDAEMEDSRVSSHTPILIKDAPAPVTTQHIAVDPLPNTPTTKSFVAIPPPSPSKHSRIPSSGNRPTVMEIAQTLLENPVKVDVIEPKSEDIDRDDLKPHHLPPSTSPANAESVPRLRSPLSQLQAEKRKSSYERYSAIILPSLKEEATPTPSPAGTLGRVNDLQDAVGKQSFDSSLRQTTPIYQTPESVVAQDKFCIPDLNFAEILDYPGQLPKTSLDTQTVSVEVMAITGTTATPLSRSSDIFYDSEILAIIHRTKSRASGLASTSIWCWLGRRSILGDREDRKIQELASRYGTRAKIVHQLAEPSELIQVLGGRLAIRQGTRTHWSSENTTMHLVRSFRGAILIDEHDLSIQNLCSAFSYCLTLLGSIYVWHGCGSTLQERNAALQYAKTFSADPVTPIVLLEGEDDDDEMFWMILGDESFAHADYWRWRKTSTSTDPSIWKVDIDNLHAPLTPVEFISMEQDVHKSIYVANCIWEFFILVGKEARGETRTIQLALDLVTKLSTEAASSRPYVPTVHVLLLPSQIPLDLQMGIRDLDVAWLNDGEIPDHMNLLHLSEAINQLSAQDWKQEALRDCNMLPLGVDVS